MAACGGGVGQDRTLRRLNALAESGSSARVLNLPWAHSIHQPEAMEPPLFRNKLLNRAIILKHRVRAHEFEEAPEGRSVVTKIIIPIDTTDLRRGAHWFFYGRRDMDASLPEMLGPGVEKGSQDRLILELLDQLPSLDPFLLREQLKLHGIEAGEGYFGVTEADVKRMYAFVESELMTLVTMGGSKAGKSESERLARKLLSQDNEQLILLKDTLRLSDREYDDGMFAWRGFLYYKWVIKDISEEAPKIINSIARIRPRGSVPPEIDLYISQSKLRLTATIKHLLSSVRDTISLYNEAYKELTERQNPSSFRKFLLSAPLLFVQLGHQLGALQHILSFWAFRFGSGPRVRAVTAEDLMDILQDFEDSLASTARLQRPGGEPDWPAAERYG
jgi:hypothetical protein